MPKLVSHLRDRTISRDKVRHHLQGTNVNLTAELRTIVVQHRWYAERRIAGR